MDKISFTPQKDGFCGSYYPNAKRTRTAIRAMVGDSSDDRMAVSAVKWLQKRGCNVMAMSPDKKDYGHHNYPLERFEKAIAYLKEQGNKKIGIVGASTTGMLALIAASYFPDITLTLAFSPCDFVMEGFYQDNLDGMHERPGNHESTVSDHGEPLPYLPFAYRHPKYWMMLKKESKEGGDMIASRKMFDESERRHPLREEEKIKIENIKGRIVCIGAEDDVLWDTCKYINRMEERLQSLPHECEFEKLLYEHGTHFIFPQGMMEIMLPVVSGLMVRVAFRAGRQYPKECKATRIDIERKTDKIIRDWRKSNRSKK